MTEERKRGGRAWKIAAFVATSGFGLYAYMFFHDCAPPDDSDLIPTPIFVADADNMVPLLMAIYENLPSDPADPQDSELDVLTPFDVVESLGLALEDEEFAVDEDIARLEGLFERWSGEISAVRERILEASERPDWYFELNPDLDLAALRATRKATEFLTAYSKLQPETAFANSLAKIRIQKAMSQYPQNLLGLTISATCTSSVATIIEELLRSGDLNQEQVLALHGSLNHAQGDLASLIRETLLGEYRFVKSTTQQWTTEFLQQSMEFYGEERKLREANFRPHRTHREFVFAYRSLVAIFESPREEWARKLSLTAPVARSVFAQTFDPFRGNSSGEIVIRSWKETIHYHLCRWLDAQSNYDAARIAASLHLYRHAHGEFPSSLSQLVPEFLPELPTNLSSPSKGFSYDRKNRWIHWEPLSEKDPDPDDTYPAGVRF